MANKNTLDEIAAWYKVEEDFDSINTLLALRIFMPYLKGKGKVVLEVGSAEGYMTGMLVDQCAVLDVLEPSDVYSAQLRKIEGIRNIFECFMEELDCAEKYDVILLAGLIHHLENPLSFLCALKPFLGENGIVLATVPNIESLHRRMGVEMGVLKTVAGDSERNIRFHQPGRFTAETFTNLFHSAGFVVLENYGFMLKPFPSEMMMRLDLDKRQIDALFRLGKKHQDLCSQLFLAARADD